MRHLFGKEHKEQKSMKLVKKLQLEEDKRWQEELQRRLEQEENDAALARQLQEELEGGSSTQAPATPVTHSPVSSHHSPTAAFSAPTITSSTAVSPPPLPVKPTAYHSGTSPASSSSSNSTRSQATQLLSGSAASSSSSAAQRNVPPPPYQSNPPRIPPRERTVSQLSMQHIPSTPSFTSNTTTTASAPPLQPTSSSNLHSHQQQQQHTSYLPSLNTAMTPGIGHQILNHQPYFPGTPQPQQQMYPPSSTPQVSAATPATITNQPPRRDPAMLIIPPRKEKQPVTNYSPVTSTMAMPEPVRSTTPFHFSSPYTSTVNVTQTPMNGHPTSSSSSSAGVASTKPAPPTAAVVTPALHRVQTPKPPVTSSNGYHSLPITTASCNPTPAMASHVSPKMASSVPVTTSYMARPSIKPDTKLEKTIEHATQHPPATDFTSRASQPKPGKMTQIDYHNNDEDDDDELESFMWERNDGRMMSSTPGNRTKKIPDLQNPKHHVYQEKYIASRNEDEHDDSVSGSDDEDDLESNGVEDDLAIDPFDIQASDTVVIHQHVKSASTSTTDRRNSKVSVQQIHKELDNVDPFADTFAVEHNTTCDSNKAESPMLHERSKSAGVPDIKSTFQMNNNSSTIAKVHDPLLMMAAAKANGNAGGSGNNGISSTRPARPTSTLPWNSSTFNSSSVTVSASPAPPVGSAIPRPASAYQYPLHQRKDDDDDDLITLDSDDIQPVVPTNVLRAGAPPNLQSMISQVTSEVPSNEFGYYRYQADKPGGEKEEIEETIVKALPTLPKLPKTDPDHRHITVPSVIEGQRVWIRVHPTDTGKSLASRIHIVATYKTRKIISITTDKGRSLPLDETPVFQDWAGITHMEDGIPWKVEWTVMDNNLWDGPKEFLRYLKASLRS